MIYGLTSANLGEPDYELALAQHREYISALQKCGLEVIILEPDENYPDSVFVEDTAVLAPEFAVITNPGAPSRKGETAVIREVINRYYKNVHEITGEGTLDAGDVLKTGRHFYTGISERTNEDGAEQLSSVLNEYGYTSSFIKVDKSLHLKTGIAYLENNVMALTEEFFIPEEFDRYLLILVEDEERYAANCIWVNGNVIMPAGYPKTKKIIEKSGYMVLEVNLSEFQKLDGGASCLSLRY